ncbi:hypothetical protein AAHC03_013158 [Spirometra sp. Aus1]
MKKGCPLPVSTFRFDNEAAIKDAEEGIYVSKLVGDGKLIGSFDNVNSVFNLLQNTVARFPDRPFLGRRSSPDGPYEWVNYKQAYETILLCGSGLLQLKSVASNSSNCVGLYATNCPEWLISELGCWAYGLVAVPLYDTLGSDAIKHICNQTELTVVVCDTPKRARCLISSKSSLPHLQTIVIISSDGDQDNLRKEAEGQIEIILFEELLSLGAKDSKEPAPLGEDGLIVICYTSGTTGTPKGAMIQNSTMLAVIAATSAVLGEGTVSEDEVHLSFLPLAHIYEQFVEAFIVYLGARIGYYSGNIMALREDMQALKPTVFTAVPRILYRIYDAVNARVSKSKFKRYLLDLAIREKLKCLDKQIYNQDTIWDKLIFSKIRRQFGGCVRICLISSAPIAPAVLRFTRALFSCPVLEGYGCTETCGPLSMSVAGDLKGGHVGAPMPSVEIKLADVPEMNLVASRDKKGEICVRGRSCINGYFKSPEKTAELIDKDGWLHTGDIGVWTSRSLKIVDRCKHIFKLSQGEYVAPEKVEMVYRESPYVAQVFVDGDTTNSFPVAIVVPEQEHLEEALVTVTKRNSSTKMANGTKSPLSNGHGTGAANGLVSDEKSERSFEELCKDPGAKSFLLSELKRLGDAAGLKGFEKVKNIYLSWQPFSIENKMLTPTLKAARPIIRDFFAKELSALYTAVPESIKS